MIFQQQKFALTRHSIFIAAWSGANAVGAAVGAGIGWSLLWFSIGNTADTGSFDFLGIFVLMPAIGVGIGAGQYLVIKRFLSQSGWWVLATAVGWIFGFCADYGMQSMGMRSPLFGFAAAGFFQGFFQWLLLRQRGSFSTLWPLASTAGWTGSGIIYNLVNEPIHALFQSNRYETAALSLAWSTAALFFGLATSLVILRLLRRSELVNSGE